MEINNSNGAIGVSSFSPDTTRSAPITMSPVELIALCELGMSGIDSEVSGRNQKQRSAIDTLRRLGKLKSEMAKHQNGLVADDDEKRGGDSKRGRMIRRDDFDRLRAAYEEALHSLPKEYRHVAEQCLATMKEQKQDGKSIAAFNADQAARMTQVIDSAISDINTMQQAAMAESNALMSKRSNLIEMTKNITIAINSQQEFVTRNAPR